MASPDIDPSLPRRRYWSTELPHGTASCPECEADLAAADQNYLMLVNCDGQPQYLQTRNAHGYFCGACPIVVLDQPAFAQLAVYQGGDAEKLQFVVFGIIPDPETTRPSSDLPEVTRFENLPGPMPKITPPPSR